MDIADKEKMQNILRCKVLTTKDQLIQVCNKFKSGGIKKDK